MTITNTSLDDAAVTYAMPTVAQLLPRIGAGDPAAWEEVVRRYGNLVSATVGSFRLQDADALDAVQMTWLRLAENAHRVHFPERLGGWLVTTARRECLRIVRQARPAPRRADKAPEAVADPGASPEQQAIDADIARTLWNLVAQLPPHQRTLLRALFTDQPRPYTDVARIAGMPPSGIGPTRGRALRRLRDKLNEHELGPGARR